MNNLFDRKFEFGLDIVKTTESDERWVVTAIASDTGKDRQRDRITERCLKSFLEQVKDGIPLLPSHFTSFPIGESFDGRIVEAEDKGEAITALEVDFELDKRFPESAVLWEDMKNGKSDKKLSIAGGLDRGERRPVWYKGGTRFVDAAILDHIAVCRPSAPGVPGAANPRTSFTSAIIKSLGLSDEEWQTLDPDVLEKGVAVLHVDVPEEGGESDNPRRIKDLDTFVEMAHEGFNAMVLSMVYPGMPGFDSNKAISLPPITDDDQIEVALSVMKRHGVKSPREHMDGERLAVKGLRSGIEDLENHAVGLDWDSKGPLLFAKVDEDQISGGGVREFDEVGGFIGGAFPFVQQSRPILGESGYSMFWSIPSVPELQVLRPNAVKRLERKMGDGIEKQINQAVAFIPLMMTRRIKMRTGQASEHTHDLILEIDFDGKAISGTTSRDFGHSHRVDIDFDRRTENTTVRERTTEDNGHRHPIAIPKHLLILEDLEETDMDKVEGVIRKGELGKLWFMSSSEDGGRSVAVLEKEPEKIVRGLRVKSYALLVRYENGEKEITRLGAGTRLAATAKAQRIIAKREDVMSVIVGRASGKLGQRTVFEAFREYVPDTAEKIEGEKVVSFQRYPVADTRQWSFTSAEGNAIINRFGGEDSDGGWDAYMKAHTWYDPARDTENSPPRLRDAYRLPHHKLGPGGNMQTFPGGVIAATAAVNGARGGIRLPAGERRSVYNHLARHYRTEMNLEPPPLRGAKDDGSPPDFDTDEFLKYHGNLGIPMDWFKAWAEGDDAALNNAPEMEDIQVDGKDEKEQTSAETSGEEAKPEEAKPEEAKDGGAESEGTEDKKEKAKSEEATDAERGLGFFARIGKMIRLGDSEEKSSAKTTEQPKEETPKDADTKPTEDEKPEDSASAVSAKELAGIVTEAVQTAMKPLTERVEALEKGVTKAKEDEASKSVSEEDKGEGEKAKDAKSEDTKPEEGGGDKGTEEAKSNEGANTGGKDSKDSKDSKDAKDSEDSKDSEEAADSGDALQKILAGQDELKGMITDQGKRLEVVEDVSGIRKSLDGQEDGGKGRGSIWKGTILPPDTKQHIRSRRAKARAAKPEETKVPEKE